MKNKLAHKVYSLLWEKCNKDFLEKAWHDWYLFLQNQEIESKGFDNSYDQIDELMNITNDNDRKDIIVCPDPWPSVNEDFAQEGFLVIPWQTAVKIAVLQGLP